MSANVVANQEYEQILIHTARTLPPNRVEQLVDFARFLEAQFLVATQEDEYAETAVEIKADNARWDALLAMPKSNTLLENLAAEALAEHQAGKTKVMAFSDTGEMVLE